LDLNFKLCAFVVNRLIKGEIEKPSGQFHGLIEKQVISSDASSSLFWKQRRISSACLDWKNEIELLAAATFCPKTFPLTPSFSLVPYEPLNFRLC
jgi:hypothetical protein